MNDETALRTYDAKTDAHKVFKGMLDGGNPPDDWNAASEGTAVARLDSASPAEP